MDPSHTVKAEARILMGSNGEAEIPKRAMSVDKKPGSKSSVSAIADNDTLVLKFTATDSGSLRAVMNSSLREVKIANDMFL